MKLHKYIVSDGTQTRDIYSIRKQCRREVLKRYCSLAKYAGDPENLTVEYVGEYVSRTGAES